MKSKESTTTIQKIQLLITCEHGGKDIPARYIPYFKGKESILDSHCGYDPGALEVARTIVKKIRCPFVYETVSRLLVEQNRSRQRKKVFSKVSSKFSEFDKKYILTRIYDPYHHAVDTCINSALKLNKCIYHFSIHTFTPELHGIIRNADIGFLYDPSRSNEKELVNVLSNGIKKEMPDIRVRKNYPYKGISDGLTTALRKRYPQTKYCGIEVEINQKHFFSKTFIWSWIKEKLPLYIEQFA
jgi:predicted N-formylglutamate amidohydrolase